MSSHVAIIGNGIAGVTAARVLRKADARVAITLVSDETDYPYARTALMYVFMGHVRFGDTKLYEDDFWQQNRIRRVRGRVEAIEPAAHRLRLTGGQALDYGKLLVATGSEATAAPWPGAHLEGVHQLWGIADVEKLDAAVGDGRAVRRAVVIGGGLTGVELAEMLHTRGVAVTFLVRDARFMGRALPPEESALVEAEIVRHGIDLRLETEAARFTGAGRVAAVETTDGETIPADVVGATVGVRPNLSALAGSGIETARGVLVDRYLRTSAPDVYAAGDCLEWRDPEVGHAPVEQLWYTARRHGLYAARNLLGAEVPYRRGVFFNSAKFFGLEWQTYGYVPVADEKGYASVLWQQGRQLVRLVYRTDTLALAGVNVMGTRYRADVCQAWIAAATPLPQVVAELPRANFDPEFHARPEKALQQAFAAAQQRVGHTPTLTLT